MPSSPAAFAASAEVWVNEGNPDRNYEGYSHVRVLGTGQRNRAYLKFAVSGVSGETEATLCLHVLDGSDDGGTVYAVDANWEPSSITWQNAPGLGAAPLAYVGPVRDSEWIEVDLGRVIDGPGTYAFAIADGSADRARYYSQASGQGSLLSVGGCPARRGTP